METILIGVTRHKENQSLLLMPNTSIECRKMLQFTIEYPDLTRCADQHMLNYKEYVERLGVPTAPYLATVRNEDLSIGDLHKSKALLGKGAFGEVHKALHLRTGALCAIKLLTRGDNGNHSARDRLNEVKILSGLSHVGPKFSS